MFEKRKQRKQAEATAAADAERKASEDASRKALLEAVDTARQALYRASLTVEETHVDGVVLKKGEVAHLIVNGAGYVEPRRLPGHWAGGTQGVSLRLAKGVTYRVGGTRGVYQQGAEVLQPTDLGLFVVTNHRCIFIGSKRTTEWAFSKLVGFSLDGPDGRVIFNVSNRQRATGVMFGEGRENESIIEPVVAAAIAKFQGEEQYKALLGEYRDALNEAERRAGTGVSPPPLGAMAPGLPASHPADVASATLFPLPPSQQGSPPAELSPPTAEADRPSDWGL
jgi:hypothetical protein